MITIFVSYIKEDAACAEAIFQSLEAKERSVWCEPNSPTLEFILYIDDN